MKNKIKVKPGIQQFDLSKFYDKHLSAIELEFEVLKKRIQKLDSLLNKGLKILKKKN